MKCYSSPQNFLHFPQISLITSSLVLTSLQIVFQIVFPIKLRENQRFLFFDLKLLFAFVSVQILSLCFKGAPWSSWMIFSYYFFPLLVNNKWVKNITLMIYSEYKFNKKIHFLVIYFNLNFKQSDPLIKILL